MSSTGPPAPRPARRNLPVAAPRAGTRAGTRAPWGPLPGIRLRSRGDRARFPADESGRFRFGRAPAGTHLLGWEPVPGTLDTSMDCGGVVGAGVTARVALDARPYATARVAATVRRGNGAPMAGLRVDLVHARSGEVP